MPCLKYTVLPSDAGCTVRELLTKRLGISSSLRKALVQRENALLLNSKYVFLSTIPVAGDVLTVDVTDPETPSPIVPVNFPLTVLWEDEHLLAVDKPAGITVHGAALTEEMITVAGAAAHYLASTAVHVVNRLDRGTSGVMLIAKSSYMHARCMELLHTAGFSRGYVAVCEGVPSPEQGIIDAPIGRDTTSLLRRCVTPKGQPAVTEYELLSQAHSRTLLKLLPQTGRTHQLRVHMAHIGHPLVGDWLYGTEDKSVISRPALHSYRLRFTHPLTGETVEVTAPLPKDMLRLMETEETSLIFRLLKENEIRNWYETELTRTFIPQECKPLEDILHLIAENRYEIWGLFHGTDLLGYACLWKAPGAALVLLDYLGVTAARRNKGLGSEILRRLHAQGRPLVTESELPVTGDSDEENAIRIRRIAFYARHGFTAAYPMATCGMAWQAMVSAAGMDLAEVMRQHKALYGPERTDVVVPLGENEQPNLPYWMK